MTGLNDNEKSALVEALENGCVVLNEVECKRLDTGLSWGLGFLKEKWDGPGLPTRRWELTAAGHIVAQLLQAQKLRWVPIAECGELEAGCTYVLLEEGKYKILGLLHRSGSWMTGGDDAPTHILHHGSTPVEAPKP